MTYDAFNQFCGTLPATTYVMQWGDAHVWKVGDKVFAIGGWSKDKQPAYTFKTSDLNYEFLCHKDGYIPAPYFANRGMKWIQQVDTSGALDEELCYYLTESYRLVVAGLSKSKRLTLGLMTP
ncbi:MmcQ/YjbR family DNA-binding protein [Alkalimonas sp. NCh-2]|uniref:MmcQ/YjbR family DNA-binding protein n=1 Tax=Alkalimonas sp. NCh-2 TaxID=3144846 RepID=UPI0031F614F3